jgi:hypothetical protein
MSEEAIFSRPLSSSDWKATHFSMLVSVFGGTDVQTKAGRIGSMHLGADVSSQCIAFEGAGTIIEPFIVAHRDTMMLAACNVAPAGELRVSDDRWVAEGAIRRLNDALSHTVILFFTSHGYRPWRAEEDRMVNDLMHGADNPWLLFWNSNEPTGCLRVLSDIRDPTLMRFSQMMMSNSQALPIPSTSAVDPKALVRRELEKRDYVYRTVAGIREDTGLDTDTIAGVIQEFCEEGVVFESIHPSKNGQSRYALRSRFEKESPPWRRLLAALRNSPD